MLVDALVVTRFEGDLFDCLAQKVRQAHSLAQAVAVEPGLLPRDFNPQTYFGGIMRGDLGPDAILQRTNYFSTRSVILRVGREHKHHIQRKAYGITLNLHVAFLHDVEE